MIKSEEILNEEMADNKLQENEFIVYFKSISIIKLKGLNILKVFEGTELIMMKHVITKDMSMYGY